ARAEVRPLRVVGIGRRLDGARADVAEATRHADPIGSHEVLRVVVVRILVVALRVPFLGGGLVEVRVREQSQTDDAGGPAIGRSPREVLPPGADLHAGILLLVLERIRRTVGADATLVEPQPEALWVRAGRFLEARLVDQTQIFPAVVAAGLELGMGRERLE